MSPVAPGSKSGGILARKSRYMRRNRQLVAQHRLHAGEPRLDLAVGRAAVAAHVVAVVAVLVDDDAVAAMGRAGAPVVQAGSFWQLAEQPSKGRALPSSQLSAPSTTLSPQVVWVHLLGLPLHLNPSSSLQVGAAVAGLRVAVVAELGQDDHAVAAAGDPVAGRARPGARKPGVDAAAIRRAAVVAHRVAVVTGLVGAANAVAAHRVDWDTNDPPCCRRGRSRRSPPWRRPRQAMARSRPCQRSCRRSPFLR